MAFALCEAMDQPWSSTGLAQLLRRLREGQEVRDSDFDLLFAREHRRVSSAFWTPVAVARRAATLLVGEAPACRVLDIGAGVGKLCLVGAATTSANFTGVERRGHLAREAVAVSQALGLENAAFIHGTFEGLEPTLYEAIFLYNPFEENEWAPSEQIDQSVELSRTRFAADVERAEAFLAKARVGTRVVTYHGFGGELPPSYRLVRRERAHTGCLELSIKVDADTGLWPKKGWIRSIVRAVKRATEPASARDAGLPTCDASSRIGAG